jgi:hypothetical protein
LKDLIEVFVVVGEVELIWFGNDGKVLLELASIKVNAELLAKL